MKRNRWNGTTFNSLLLNIHYVRLNLIVSQQIVGASPAIVVVFLRIEGFLIKFRVNYICAELNLSVFLPCSNVPLPPLIILNCRILPAIVP